MDSAGGAAYMVRRVIVAMTVGLFALVLRAQDDPLRWLPLQVGSSWRYEHEWKSGDPRRPTVEHWTTDERITEWVAVPEGLVVLHEMERHGTSGEPPVRVLGLDGQTHAASGSDGAYVVAREREPYLVRGNCVYVMDNGFDTQSRQLRPDYRRSLTEGTLSPEFCFPLETGRRWGTADIPWRVEPATRGAKSFSPAEYPNAIHIVCGHFGSGGRKDTWFQRGVGPVAEHYWHNGSYDEYTKKLVSFAQ